MIRIFLMLMVIFWVLPGKTGVLDPVKINSILESRSDLTEESKSSHPGFFEHNSVIIWGGSSEDEDETDLNEYIASAVVDFRIKRWIGQPDNVIAIIEDDELTGQQLDDYNLILVGTPVSNLVLKAIMPFLPLRVSTEDEKIYAGERTFSGDEVGVTFRYPNPLNPERMVWVVTAPSYEAIRFIPKEADYCVYELTDYSPQADRFLELAQGNFDENWQLGALNMVDNEEVYSGENDPIEAGEIKFYPVPDWASRGVMYEIFVRSFFDSDGDGIGDLKGITGKLDYLNDGDPDTSDDLGIKLIWLMPIFESPSYHCYDVADYYAIESDYGTNEDFQELLREAHKRGIKIITDLVLNHCSSQHPFFRDAYNNPDSDYDEWFFFTNASNTKAHNWQFRHREKDRSMLEPYMPAWNVNNPEVQRYLFDMALYWMDPNQDGDFSDGIDGFRCDYVKGPPHAFWKKFRQEVKALNPQVLLLAENWEGLMSISESFDDEFDMAFDFPFQGSLIGTVSSGNNRDLVNVLNEQKAILPEHALMNRFANNHDMNRIFSRLTPEQARLSLSLLLLMPDMPMLYYGDEIGMKGVKDPYDEGIRRPMEWCRDNDCPGLAEWYPVWSEEVDGISVEEQTADPGSILSMIRELISLRDSYPALEKGEIEFIPVLIKDGDELKNYTRAMAYSLQYQNNRLLIIANLHKEHSLLVDTDIDPYELELLHGDEDLVLSVFENRITGLFPEKSVQVFNISD